MQPSLLSRIFVLVRLCIMMFLEFFVWGAWYSVLTVYMLNGLKFSDPDSGTIMSLLPLASIFMPLLAGQITDRLMPTQIYLALAHLIGAAGFFIAAAQQSYWPFLAGMLVWSLAYAPTISLTNSLAFSHLKDAQKSFGLVRVFGTFGWIAAGLSLGFWRKHPESVQPCIDKLTTSLGLGSTVVVTGNDCLYLSAAAGVVMGVFCLLLPHTPPKKEGVSPWAFLQALSLLKSPRIAIFLLISFVVGTELPFYFSLSGPFLNQLGTKDEDLSVVLTIAQGMEILTMLALPFFLKAFGPRLTLFIGVLAWPVRYLIFSLAGYLIGTNAASWFYWIVLASLTLHGLCFVFFFVVAFIYIDSVAPKDIKGSAQGLLTLTIYGLGMWLGSYFAFYIKNRFTEKNGVIDWTKVFLVPSALTIACAVILFFTFPRGNIQNAAPESPAAH